MSNFRRWFNDTIIHTDYSGWPVSTLRVGSLFSVGHTERDVHLSRSHLPPM